MGFINSWGALLGLQLASSINATNIWLESDCSYLVNLLTDCNLHSLHHCAPLINSCRCYLSHFSNVKVTHECADALASFALHSKCSYVSSTVCPPFVSAKFIADLVGTYTPRGIG